MTKHIITLLPGDGIGPEVTAAVVQIIECAGVEVEWEKYVVGAEAGPCTQSQHSMTPGAHHDETQNHTPSR